MEEGEVAKGIASCFCLFFFLFIIWDWVRGNGPRSRFGQERNLGTQCKISSGERRKRRREMSVYRQKILRESKRKEEISDERLG